MLAATAVLVLRIGWATYEQKTPEATIRGGADEAAALSIPKPEPLGGNLAPDGALRKAERKEQAAKKDPSGNNSKLDINSATVQDLQRLPGIGAVLAQRVIEHRKAYGPFQTIDDLKSVKGIGPKRIEHLRAWVRVGVRKEAAQGAIEQMHPSARQSRRDQ